MHRTDARPPPALLLRVDCELTYTHRRLVDRRLAASLFRDAAYFPRLPVVPGPFRHHGSRDIGCSCPRCTADVVATDCDAEPIRVSESLARCLASVEAATGLTPDTHCINVLRKGYQHLHHVDGVAAWTKVIVLLKRPEGGGILSVAPRCSPCGCLDGSACRPDGAVAVDLDVGDAYEVPAGRVCHGISEVTKGVRASWVLRYSSRPPWLPTFPDSSR